jgi:hypothetical protein
LIPGVGSNTSQGENSAPSPSSRTVEVQAFNTEGTLSKSSSGPLVFDSATSSFKGTVSLGNLSSGAYKIKIRFDNTLWKAVAANLSLGQLTTIRATKLITGDINGDNELNLLDYNSLISCTGGKTCTQKSKADLNMDGKVDEKDLNIMYVAFSTRQGD